MPKLKKSNETFWVIFKQCAAAWKELRTWLTYERTKLPRTPHHVTSSLWHSGSLKPCIQMGQFHRWSKKTFKTHWEHRRKVKVLLCFEVSKRINGRKFLISQSFLLFVAAAKAAQGMTYPLSRPFWVIIHHLHFDIPTPQVVKLVQK